MSSPKQRAYNALAKALNSPNADSQGYLSDVAENLLPDIDFGRIRNEIENGSGNELQQNLLAIHSSTALAVNAFGFFKSSDSISYVRDGRDHEQPIFERKCRTGLGGTPPNLDVWFAAGNEGIVAIESKLTEYFERGKAEYTASYCRDNLPDGESCWWDVLDKSKGKESHLGVAQLVKHYFGLRRHMLDEGVKDVELLYVFWEPKNASEFECCVKHRGEIEGLANAVEDSEVKFSAMSYSELWQEWDQVPELQNHVANLRKRYDIAI